MKNQLTPAGIETPTFQFVEEHLNHCATAVPQIKYMSPENLGTLKCIFLEEDNWYMYIYISMCVCVYVCVCVVCGVWGVCVCVCVCVCGV